MYSTEKKDDKVTMDLNNFILTTRYTLGLSYKDSVEIFERIDNEKSSLITYGKYFNYGNVLIWFLSVLLTISF